jgi:uncharacterized protein
MYLENPLDSKRRDALQRIAGSGGAVVAFSGGVDSTLALKLAMDALGAGRVVAATGVSASLPQDELDDVRRIAAELGATLRTVSTNEIADPVYVANGGRRCFACKSELYGTLRRLADELGLPAIVNGVIAGDDDGTRPGVQAAREAGVLMPLIDAGIDKADVRALAAHYRLPNATKPASPCLASRVPFGTPVTIETLGKIERAERVLRQRGFAICRVRHHQSVARIEVPGEDIPRLLADPLRTEVHEALRAIGYAYVAVDLLGFRSGSAHEAPARTP